MVKRYISFAVCISIVTANSFAETTTSSGTGTTNPCPLQVTCLVSGENGTTTTTTNTVDRPTGGLVSETPGSGVTTVDTQYAETGTAGEGVYNQAESAESQSMMTKILGGVIAATNLPSCGRPGGQAQCALGFAGLGLMALGSGGQQSADYTQEEMGSGGDTKDTSVGTKDTAVVGADINKLKDNAAKSGYKIDKDGNTILPGGGAINPDMNKQQLMTAGMTGKDADAYMNGIKDMKAKLDAKLKDMQNASGGGGAGTGSIQGAVGSGGGDPNGESVAMSNDQDGSRDPAAWNGFYKQFGDSVIGVSQSDIFGLVINRVENERKAMGQ